MPSPNSSRRLALRVAAIPMIAVLALGACKVGAGAAGDAKSPDGKDKGPEAVPVEVAKAERRTIAASYNNTLQVVFYYCLFCYHTQCCS